MKLPRKKLSLWTRIKAFLVSIWWKIRGEVLHDQLQDHTSPLRTEAQIAVDRVVYETHIAADCVSAAIVRGGPAILVKHDPHGNGATTTVTIGNTYEEAATKTIEWLKVQGPELTTKKASQLSYAETRRVNVLRAKARRKRRRRH